MIKETLEGDFEMERTTEIMKKIASLLVKMPPSKQNIALAYIVGLAQGGEILNRSQSEKDTKETTV